MHFWPSFEKGSVRGDNVQLPMDLLDENCDGSLMKELMASVRDLEPQFFYLNFDFGVAGKISS